MRFIRTKNNRAPDGEDRYAVRSTCFLAEDRNTIVLQGDGFIAAGRISAQCDMDAKVGAASESCRKDIRYFIPQQPSGILRKSLCTLCSSIGIRLWQNGGTMPLHFATVEFDCISG